MLARIAVQCVSMTKAILSADLHLRNLYKGLAQKRSWQDLLNIDPATRADLEWWRSTLKAVQLTTDASKSGHGVRGGAEDRYLKQL